MIEIRPLNKYDDPDTLVELSRSFLKEYEGHHKEFFKLDTVRAKDAKKIFIDSLNGKNSRTILALDDGAVIGFMSVSMRVRTPPFYRIKRIGHGSVLIVKKEYRRRGIAALLIKEAMRWFKSKGVKYFDLETSAKNKKAIEFYRKHRFELLRVQFLGKV